RAMSLLLAEDVGRLILLGNPESSEAKARERLLTVASDLAQFVAARHAEGAAFGPGTLAADLLALLPDRAGDSAALARAVDELERAGRLVLSQDAQHSVRQAQVVVTATSATGTILEPDDLRPHAVVCDVSRPANVSPEMVTARPDVLVMGGGVIAVPGGSAL